MRNEIVIGKRTSRMWSAWLKRSAGDLHISHNEEEYWISGIIGQYEGEMKIVKNTAEGMQLTDVLSRNVSDSALQEFVVGTYLQHVDPRTLLNIIDSMRGRSYDSGRRYQASVVRKALYLD